MITSSVRFLISSTVRTDGPVNGLKMGDQPVMVRLRRNTTSTPWGFRMQGGNEYGAVLFIQKVNIFVFYLYFQKVVFLLLLLILCLDCLFVLFFFLFFLLFFFFLFCFVFLLLLFLFFSFNLIFYLFCLGLLIDLFNIIR